MNRKIQFFVAGLLVLSMFSGINKLKAQKTEITPMAGWMFGGHLKFYEGKFNINGNWNYGVSLNTLLANNNRIEFNYTQMNTSSDFSPYYIDYTAWKSDIRVMYFQLGSYQDIIVNEKVSPFAGLSLGAAYFDVKESYISDVWRFAVTLGGGVKVYLSDRIGLRFQGRLMMPLYFAGVGFYAGSGGSGMSLNAGSVLLQGDFQGGLIFRLQ